MTTRTPRRFSKTGLRLVPTAFESAMQMPNRRLNIKHRFLSISMLILALASLSMMDTALAQGACKRTASRMFEACNFDLLEENKLAQANCTNITDTHEQRACLDEARMTQREERELCHTQRRARLEACELLAEDRYDPDPLLDPAIEFVDPDDVDENTVNPYVSVIAGHTYVLRAGEDFEETVVVHVTEESREILGVLCRIVVDIVFVAEEDEEDGGIDYIPVEHTDDWFAQDTARNVYYCGEVARNFEDGQLVDLDGSFEAGKERAKSGVLIKAFPITGEAHRQEFALGEAEDIIQYGDLAAIPSEEEGGENSDFPCSSDPNGCLMTFDFTPLAPESTEFKYYLPGVGFVLGVALEDGELTGERDELVCVGDSLEILQDPSCEIEDPEELLEELCELSPDAFCEDDED